MTFVNQDSLTTPECLEAIIFNKTTATSTHTNWDPKENPYLWLGKAPPSLKDVCMVNNPSQGSHERWKAFFKKWEVISNKMNRKAHGFRGENASW